MKTYDHTWLIAEWERMGRPLCECKGTSLQWGDVSGKPAFHPQLEYRIKCKPWIDWEHVSDDFAFIATDKNGKSYAYTHPPRISPNVDATVWFIGGSASTCSTKPFASFTPCTCDWRDSLVMRPVVIGEEK